MGAFSNFIVLWILSVKGSAEVDIESAIANRAALLVVLRWGKGPVASCSFVLIDLPQVTRHSVRLVELGRVKILNTK